MHVPILIRGFVLLMIVAANVWLLSPQISTAASYWGGCQARLDEGVVICICNHTASEINCSSAEGDCDQHFPCDDYKDIQG